MQQPVGSAPTRRRLSARQTFQRLTVRSLDIEQRLCVSPQEAERKERAELKLVGAGNRATVYSLGTAIAVKRILRPSMKSVLDPSTLQQSPFLFQAYQYITNEYRQSILSTEEFVAALVGQYGLAPYVYRVDVCPVTGYRLMFMERWDRTLETDLSAARCAEHNMAPLLPWFQQPLRIWRDLGLKVMELNSFGILHNDIHNGNVVVRRDPLSGQPQIALIDFGLARIALQDTQRQRLHDFSVIFREIFAEWNRLGWLDVPLTNTEIMKTAIKQFLRPLVDEDSVDFSLLQDMMKEWWFSQHNVTDIIACAAEAPEPVLPGAEAVVAVPEGQTGRPKRRHSSPTI